MVDAGILETLSSLASVWFARAAARGDATARRSYCAMPGALPTGPLVIEAPGNIGHLEHPAKVGNGILGM